jgi:hypothetical protein
MSTPSAWLLVAAWASLVACSSAAGQTLVEVRGGLAVGSHTATAAGLDFKPALSVEALVVRRTSSRFSVYGGYDRTAFGCAEGFCLERDLTVVGNHGVLGMEVRAAGPWLRLGVLFGATEVGTEGDPYDRGPGLHGAAGYAVGSGRVSFRPGLSYRWMSAKTASTSDHAVALSLDLGLGIRLGS